ncbi:MAG TPA: alkaline phosphatase family protein [Actinomycetota bacterium]|nr:alkaline phosphatase family protein [Actinomycetota bacterium]
MDRSESIDAALGVLLSDEQADIVDLVLCARGGVVEAHARDGSVGFTRDGTVAFEKGRNPLAAQDAGAFSPLADEMQHVRPTNETNHYPYAYDNAGQLFDDPRAPDLAVIHTPAHNWEERGGHRGEHGSLDLIQSRAPLIVAGAGVKTVGRIDREARMINVAPTLATLAGVQPLNGTLLRAQDGEPLHDVLDGEQPDHVVGFLWDGANANVLYAMADAGELPNLARLMSMGTTFGRGCIASFPSVTLANHTTALTGVHPGRHGVLHNFFFDRATNREIITNSPETWHEARDWISPNVETVFEAVARSGGGFTAAVDEPVDRGAGYATFDLVRAARGSGATMSSALPDPTQVPGATQTFVDLKREYGWATSADHLAVMQATQVWKGQNGNPTPRFMWINLILPDAANHAGGPYSDIGHAGLRDTDARMGEILDAMDWGGGNTAFLLVADHGMEESDPECKGDFDEALTAAGISFRDEGYGFIYLDA